MTRPSFQDIVRNTAAFNSFREYAQSPDAIDVIRQMAAIHLQLFSSNIGSFRTITKLRMLEAYVFGAAVPDEILEEQRFAVVNRQSVIENARTFFGSFAHEYLDKLGAAVEEKVNAQTRTR